MRFLSLLSVSWLLFTGCERPPQVPEAFIGHFVSDKEATIERWRSERPWKEKTEKIIETLGPTLGKLEVVSDGSNFTSFYGDWKDNESVGFRPINDVTAEIRDFSEEYGIETNARLEADADGYWLYSDSVVIGYCERFTRKPEANKAE